MTDASAGLCGSYPSKLERTILEFAGRLTQEQRSKLLEIAEKYPVRRTLVSGIDIRSRVL